MIKPYHYPITIATVCAMNLLPELSPFLYVYLVAVMVLAGFVHGAIGLGFPMVATPLIAVFLDVRLAILITLVPTIAVNIASILRGENFRNSLSQFRPLFVLVLVGSIIGSVMLAFLDPAPFRFALALLILLYLWVTLSGKLQAGWIGSSTTLAMVGFGLAAGISGGITNVMIAILLIYFLSLQTPRPTMIPVVNTCFLIGKVSQITILSLAGLVSLQLVVQTLPLALAGLGALLAGQKIGAMIDDKRYTRLIHVLLFVLAVILIIQFSSDLLERPI